MTVEDLIRTSYDVGLEIRNAIGRGIISNAEQEARSKQVKSVTTMIADGDPASVILEVADKEKPDLLVRTTLSLLPRGEEKIAGMHQDDFITHLMRRPAR